MAQGRQSGETTSRLAYSTPFLDLSGMGDAVARRYLRFRHPVLHLGFRWSSAQRLRFERLWIRGDPSTQATEGSYSNDHLQSWLDRFRKEGGVLIECLPHLDADFG